MSGLIVRREPNPAGLIIIIFLFLVIAVLFAMTYYEPLNPGVMHAYMIGMLHGGVTNTSDDDRIESCVAFVSQQKEQRGDGVFVYNRTDYLSVHIVQRTYTYRDRSKLTIIYDSKPYKDPQCE